MIPSLPYLLVGYRTLRTDENHTARLLEVCRRYRLPYEDIQNLEDGGISLRLRLPAARALRGICAEYGIPLTAVNEGGLSLLLRRLSRRLGLVAGALLGVALYLLSQSVFWDIRVSGNQTVSDRAVKESLAACGLTVGTPIRGFEADVTENNVLLYDDRLAWLSVNRKGTVAYVEVREAVKTPHNQPDPPRDLVASRGGVIEYIELEEGNVRVRAGQTVSEGQVLVSGLYDSIQEGVRIGSAKARVFARTAREFSVTVPLSYERKTYPTAANGEKSEILQEKSLIFFGRHIKFSNKCGNPTEFCDIMEDEKSWGLIDGVGFPISTRTVRYLPYEITTATRTYAEAEELAYFELAKYVASIGGSTLLAKSVTVTHAEDALILSARLTLIEDIAAERIIQVEDGSP